MWLPMAVRHSHIDESRGPLNSPRPGMAIEAGAETSLKLLVKYWLTKGKKIILYYYDEVDKQISRTRMVK